MAKYLKCDECGAYKEETSWGLPPQGWVNYWEYGNNNILEKKEFCSREHMLNFTLRKETEKENV